MSDPSRTAPSARSRRGRAAPPPTVHRPAPAVPAVGFYGGGGYVFAPFEDKRRRISLRVMLAGLAALRRDPGNDLVLGAGLMGVGLGYEHAFD